MAQKQTLGQLLDFLGAKLPPIEEGDVITEAVILAVSYGEEGETLHVLHTADMSWLKAAGVLAIAAAGAVSGGPEEAM